MVVTMRSKREQAILDSIKEWESQLVEQEATDFQRMFDKWVHNTIAKLPEKNEKISLRKQMDGSFICMH